MCAFGVSRSTRFNPRARAGRDGLQHQFGAVADVSIHAPVRGATTKPASASRWTVFQSTRPCGARQQLRCSFHEVTMFQSTRPCGARPPQPGRRRPAAQVSIHAPVRGATVQGDPPRPEGRPVSIHAPVRGATGVGRIAAQLAPVSIHAPVRGATTPADAAPRTVIVSIHAPVRGATRQGLQVTALRPVSIHAPVRGATRAC